MKNNAKEINQTYTTTPHKYSLRQHIQHQKIYKNKVQLNLNTQNYQPRQDVATAKQHSTLIVSSNRNSNWTEKDSINAATSCIKFPRTAGETRPSQPKSFNHQTPSTAYSAEYKGIQTLQFSKPSIRLEGGTKLSLRTYKKNTISRTSSRMDSFANPVRSEERHFT